MKILIIVPCLLALANAGYYGGLGGGYGGALHHHVPVIGPHGVPLETPEVAAARAEHLAAHAAAKSHGGYGVGVYAGGFQGAGAYGGGIGGEIGGGEGHHHHQKYHGPIHIPKIGKDGVPYDTPEVVAARAAHLKALHEAASRDAGHHYYGGENHYRYRRGAVSHASIYTPVSHENIHVVHGHHYGSPWAHDHPAIGHDGQPLETPEVVALKHAHFAAHHEAIARLHHHGFGGHEQIAPIEHGFVGGYAGGYGEGFGHHHHHHHIPVIGPHGVPLDTPEVAAAKHAHFAAHAEAAARAYHKY